jgi:hypothetical protein
MYGWREPMFPGKDGLPARIHSSYARSRESMWALAMYILGSSRGCRSPRRECKVAHIAIVTRDQTGRGASC